MLVGHHHLVEGCFYCVTQHLVRSEPHPPKTIRESELTGPWSEECTQANQGQDQPVGDVYAKPNILNLKEEDEGAGKKGMSAHEAHAPPFPKRPKNPLLEVFLSGRSIMQCHLDS